MVVTCGWSNSRLYVTLTCESSHRIVQCRGTVLKRSFRTTLIHDDAFNVYFNGGRRHTCEWNWFFLICHEYTSLQLFEVCDRYCNGCSFLCWLLLTTCDPLLKSLSELWQKFQPAWINKVDPWKDLHIFEVLKCMNSCLLTQKLLRIVLNVTRSIYHTIYISAQKQN